MKKKLIILTIMSALISFLIYFYTKNDDLTLTSLGDGLSLGMTPYNIKGYSFNDYFKQDLEKQHLLKNYYFEFAYPHQSLQDLIYEIKNNKTLTLNNETINIQRAINEADILTVAIGMDEISTAQINSTYRRQFQSQFSELSSLIKTLNHGQVIVLSLYCANQYDALTIAKLNAIIRDISLSNNFIYIDINNLLNKPEYYLTKNSYYLNYLAHKAIYEEIQKYLKLT